MYLTMSSHSSCVCAKLLQKWHCSGWLHAFSHRSLSDPGLLGLPKSASMPRLKAAIVSTSASSIVSIRLASFRCVDSGGVGNTCAGGGGQQTDAGMTCVGVKGSRNLRSEFTIGAAHSRIKTCTRRHVSPCLCNNVKGRACTGVHMVGGGAESADVSTECDCIMQRWYERRGLLPCR